MVAHVWLTRAGVLVVPSSSPPEDVGVDGAACAHAPHGSNGVSAPDRRALCSLATLPGIHSTMSG
jgi:hypothetical protein